MVGEWQDISTAPRDAPILVWFAHDADPYQDPANPGKLTDYACHAEGGDFLTGRGVAIVQWCEGWYEDEGWESTNGGYSMPAAWFAQLNGENTDYVVNALGWLPLPNPPELSHD